MMMKRDLSVSVALTIVTCGIYGLFWFLCLHKDTQKLSGKTSCSAGVAFLLRLLTCNIYGLIWVYQRGKLIREAYQKRGHDKFEYSELYLLLSLIGLEVVSYALIQRELNKIIDIDNGLYD